MMALQIGAGLALNEHWPGLVLGEGPLTRAFLFPEAECTLSNQSRLINDTQAMTDFSKGKRGPLIVDPDKTRVTILLDNKILDHFRDKADKAGHGYNQMINDILLAHIREGSKKH